MKVYFNSKNVTAGLADKIHALITELDYDLETESSNRAGCDLLVYIVDCSMHSIKPIIDVVDDSNHHPSKTIFWYNAEEIEGTAFNDHQIKSLAATGKMVQRNGGNWMQTLEDTFNHLKRVSLLKKI